MNIDRACYSLEHIYMATDNDIGRLSELLRLYLQYFEDAVDLLDLKVDDRISDSE